MTRSHLSCVKLSFGVGRLTNPTKNAWNMAQNVQTPCYSPAPPFSDENYPRLKSNQSYAKGSKDLFYKRFLKIEHADSNTKMADLNPFHVDRQLKALLGKKTFYKANKIRSGHLLIEVDRKDIVEKLKRTKTLGDIPVVIKEHNTLNSCKGRIFCDNREVKEMTNDEIKAEMNDQSVTEVYRQLKKNEKDEEEKLDSFIITFDKLQLPNTVKIGYEIVEVKPYYPNPRRCFNCQLYGHGKVTCTHEPVCAKCAQKGHEYDDCENDFVLCFHCEQEHKTSDKRCPMYKLEKMIIEEKTKTNITFREARRRIYSVNPELTRQIPKIKTISSKTSYSSISAQPPIPNEIKQQLQNQQHQIITLTEKITELLTIIQQSPAMSVQVNVDDSDMDTDLPKIKSYQRRHKHKRSRTVVNSQSSDDDSFSSPSRRKVASSRMGATNVPTPSVEGATPPGQGVPNMPAPLPNSDRQVKGGEGGKPPQPVEEPHSGGKATVEEVQGEKWIPVTGKNTRKTGSNSSLKAAPSADSSSTKKPPSKLPQAKHKVNPITPPKS